MKALQASYYLEAYVKCTTKIFSLLDCRNFFSVLYDHNQAEGLITSCSCLTLICRRNVLRSNAVNVSLKNWLYLMYS
jgi:hypothetical protein